MESKQQLFLLSTKPFSVLGRTAIPWVNHLAIMIAARAGSAITAEIGIQRISEQIDALDTISWCRLRRDIPAHMRIISYG